MYPLPAVNVELLDAVSALPITKEFDVGVNEPTDREVDPAEELPGDVWTPEVE